MTRPKVGEHPDAARADVLAFTSFPRKSGGRSGPATRYLLTGSGATRSCLPPEVRLPGSGGVDAAGYPGR